VTRQAEVILHLAAGETPYFDKSIWPNLDARLGGWNAPYESGEKVTDVWYLPTGNGKNGHGAEFAVSLPGRCISLTTKPGDVVVDPFVGSGTSALAAMELGRRCIGFDTSQTYLATAHRRVKQLATRIRAEGAKLVDVPMERTNGAQVNARSRSNGHKVDSDVLPLVVAADPKDLSG
jgi:site-specific DNA-methyltransferase (cytosine-N4-specific)